MFVYKSNYAQIAKCFRFIFLENISATPGNIKLLSRERFEVQFEVRFIQKPSRMRIFWTVPQTAPSLLATSTFECLGFALKAFTTFWRSFWSTVTLRMEGHVTATWLLWIVSALHRRWFRPFSTPLRSSYHVGFSYLLRRIHALLFSSIACQFKKTSTLKIARERLPSDCRQKVPESTTRSAVPDKKKRTDSKLACVHRITSQQSEKIMQGQTLPRLGLQF